MRTNEIEEGCDREEVEKGDQNSVKHLTRRGWDF